jgi:Mn-dependent DtxR family transcriptional regulator
MVKGAPDGSEQATVNDLADRLKVAPHTITAATSRVLDEVAGLATYIPRRG